MACNSFLTCLLLLYTMHLSVHAMNALVPAHMYTMLSTIKLSEHTISCAIVACTHAGAATASFEDLVTLHKRTLQQIFW